MTSTSSEQAPLKHSFRAMGTDVSVIASPDSGTNRFADASHTAEAIFEEEEQRFSRFRISSELSLVNARAGEWTNVSAPFAEVTRLALDGARRSGGLFDPTLLPALVDAGYDRDFSLVEKGGDERPERLSSGSTHSGTWGEIELDVERLRLRMPPGSGLDFGGLAKGWTVDRAVAKAEALPWVLVAAGGDLRVGGSNVPSEGLEIALEDPFDREAEVMRLRLESGGLATSSIEARTWGAGLHHLIDPRTGRPADRNVVQATAWADTCAGAEVASKWALLGGPAALDHLSAVLVLAGGDLLTNLDGVPAAFDEVSTSELAHA